MTARSYDDGGRPSVAVVVPLHARDYLTPDETISLRHLTHHLRRVDPVADQPLRDHRAAVAGPLQLAEGAGDVAKIPISEAEYFLAERDGRVFRVSDSAPGILRTFSIDARYIIFGD